MGNTRAKKLLSGKEKKLLEIFTEMTCKLYSLVLQQPNIMSVEPVIIVNTMVLPHEINLDFVELNDHHAQNFVNNPHCNFTNCPEESMNIQILFDTYVIKYV